MIDSTYGLVDFIKSFIKAYILFYLIDIVLIIFLGAHLQSHIKFFHGFLFCTSFLAIIFYEIVYKKKAQIIKELSLEPILFTTASKFSLLGLSAGIAALYLLHFFPSYNRISDVAMNYARQPEIIPIRAFYIAALAPLFEEIIWRGFAYPAVKKSLGPLLSSILTSTIFSILHLADSRNAYFGFVYMFIFSSVLILIKEKTKSTSTCIIFHVFYNSARPFLQFIRNLI